MYASATSGLDAAHPVFPFAVPFTNPGTSDFAGVAGTFQGLLPFNEIAGCSGCVARSTCAYAAPPSDATEVLGFGSIVSMTCVWESADVRRCEGQYGEADEPWRPIRVEMSATFTNVAMGLRVLDATRLEVAARADAVIGPWQPQPVTYAAAMNDGSVLGRPAGSVTITFGATLPNIDAMGWAAQRNFACAHRARRHCRSRPADLAPTTGWFVRNQWYRLVYYAIAPEHAASAAAPRSCTSCLQITNVAPAGKQRAILVLAGRSLSGAAAQCDARRLPGRRNRRSRPRLRESCGKRVLQRSRGGRGRQLVKRLGFSLIEMAVVLAIFGLVLGSTLFSVSAQFENRNRVDTERRLEHARELLLSYALVHGRCLPAVASGDEGRRQRCLHVQSARTSPAHHRLPARRQRRLRAGCLGKSHPVRARPGTQWGRAPTRFTRQHSAAAPWSIVQKPADLVVCTLRTGGCDRARLRCRCKSYQPEYGRRACALDRAQRACVGRERGAQSRRKRSL